MKIKICIIIISVFIMLTAGIVAADIITVDDSGGQDYSRIQDAVNNADSNDKIIVYPGDYIENIIVNNSLEITSVSGNPDDTIVQVADPNYDVFRVTADNVTIQGFGINGSTGKNRAGICFEGVEDCVISNNVFLNNYYGIHFVRSNNSILARNNLSLSNNFGGVFLEYSGNNEISDNIIMKKGKGILLDDFSENNSLIGNTILENDGGIFLRHFSNNNQIVNNTIGLNNNGIRLDTHYNVMDSNVVYSNKRYGIYVSGNNKLSNNNISNNGYGIFLFGNNNELHNNIVQNNTDYGISLKEGNHNKLSNNNVKWNHKDGIRIWGSGTQAEDDAVFAWDNSRYNELVDNNASHNTNHGIFIGATSNNNTLENNTASYNEIGIGLENSNYNMLFNNTATMNSLYDIHIEIDDNKNVLDGNTGDLNISYVNFSDSGYKYMGGDDFPGMDIEKSGNNTTASMPQKKTSLNPMLTIFALLMAILVSRRMQHV